MKRITLLVVLSLVLLINCADIITEPQIDFEVISPMNVVLNNQTVVLTVTDIGAVKYLFQYGALVRGGEPQFLEMIDPAIEMNDGEYTVTLADGVWAWTAVAVMEDGARIYPANVMFAQFTIKTR